MSLLELSIDPSNQAASDAREALLAWSDEFERRSLSDLRTVVSELVALSVVSGASQRIGLRIKIDDEEAHGTIIDSGHAARAVEKIRTRTDGSWVSQIVDGLVEDWGANSDQTAVWFRMSVHRLRKS